MMDNYSLVIQVHELAIKSAFYLVDVDDMNKTPSEWRSLGYIQSFKFSCDNINQSFPAISFSWVRACKMSECQEPSFELGTKIIFIPNFMTFDSDNIWNKVIAIGTGKPGVGSTLLDKVQLLGAIEAINIEMSIDEPNNKVEIYQVQSDESAPEGVVSVRMR